MKSVSIKKINTPIEGVLSFPGDKSLSHRAIIFASLAEGTSHFTNVLSGEDCVCTRKAFEAMGVKIHAKSESDIRIEGKGLRSLKTPAAPLDLGNSGTSMRLLLGILAGQNFQATVTGDASLSSRPMRRVTDFLKQMGARLEGKDNANFAPITIHGAALKSVSAKLPVPSAQVKSALLLAGLYAEGKTTVTEPVKSRDHTEKFLKYFGAKIEEEGLSVSVTGGQKLEAKSFEIAGDISSAAFFMALAALLPKAAIRFQSVLWNPTRTGVIEILKRIGVEIKVTAQKKAGPEDVADFSIHSSQLKSFEIKKEELPALIDEIPILMVLATQAEGVSVIHEADELRVKETDRIHSMSTGLRAMGADIRVEGNTLYIKGKTALHAARVSSFKDHRTAMSLIIAGCIAEGEAEVEDIECIDTSFPSFFELLKQLKIDAPLFP